MLQANVPNYLRAKLYIVRGPTSAGQLRPDCSGDISGINLARCRRRLVFLQRVDRSCPGAGNRLSTGRHPRSSTSLGYPCRTRENGDDNRDESATTNTQVDAAILRYDLSGMGHSDCVIHNTKGKFGETQLAVGRMSFLASRAKAIARRASRLPDSLFIFTEQV